MLIESRTLTPSTFQKRNGHEIKGRVSHHRSPITSGGCLSTVLPGETSGKGASAALPGNRLIRSIRGCSCKTVTSRNGADDLHSSFVCSWCDSWRAREASSNRISSRRRIIDKGISRRLFDCFGMHGFEGFAVCPAQVGIFAQRDSADPGLGAANMVGNLHLRHAGLHDFEYEFFPVHDALSECCL